ncbi:hypothetical protein [Aquipseudomonas alcaligenes]|uniref:hypothetical protein n=1 Tax=Aquipseudomonas alcaligenes TaxID=43263 RepID=UPI0012E8149E|nr:hypothetical protein [Pseudomonas alcaligenes]
MKRIFWVGPALAFVVGSLGGCASAEKEPSESVPPQAASQPADSEAKRIAKQQLQNDIQGVKTVIVVACSEKLEIPNVDRPEDLAAVTECAEDQLAVIATEALALRKAKQLPDSEVGQFMLTQAVAFLQANSEYARARDPAEIIQIARESGRKQLLTKPE